MSTHQGTYKKKQSRNFGSPTNTIKTILYNTSVQKNTTKKQIKQIEAIVYQIRSQIYSTRNNEYQISYKDDTRIKLHLINIIRTVKEERMLARGQTNLIDVMEKITMEEL